MCKLVALYEKDFFKFHNTFNPEYLAHDILNITRILGEIFQIEDEGGYFIMGEILSRELGIVFYEEGTLFAYKPFPPDRFLRQGEFMTWGIVYFAAYPPAGGAFYAADK